MFAFLCSHIRAVNATCLETPVTASRQKQNHSFTAMPGARMTDEKKKRKKKKHSTFPTEPWTAPNTWAKHRGVDGIVTWQTAWTDSRRSPDQKVSCHSHNMKGLFFKKREMYKSWRNRKTKIFSLPLGSTSKLRITKKKPPTENKIRPKKKIIKANVGTLMTERRHEKGNFLPFI